MKRFQIVLCISLFLLFLPAAKGQVGVYASFSASNLSSPNAPWIYGPTFGAYYDGVHLPVVNFGADLRASILGSGGNKIDSGLIGARAVIHAPLLPIKPYGELLIGAAHVQANQGFAATDKTAFEYAALGALRPHNLSPVRLAGCGIPILLVRRRPPAADAQHRTCFSSADPLNQSGSVLLGGSPLL